MSDDLIFKAVIHTSRKPSVVDNSNGTWKRIDLGQKKHPGHALAMKMAANTIEALALKK